MNNRLYVGNLAFHTTENTLLQTFSSCGTVTEAKLVLDRETGKEVGRMGSMGESAGSFWGLHMIAVDSRGMIYTGEVFGPLAAAAGVTVEQLLAGWGEDQTLLGRLPTLAQVADAAVFAASDRAAAITGAVLDRGCGNAIRAKHFGQALVGVLD